jgi:hypothetical protein
MSVLLVVLVGTPGPLSFAQQKEVVRAGRKGDLHIASTVRAGDVLLKPGMYEVQRVLEGEGDVIVFTEMKMPGPFEKGRTMNDSVRKEVARVKCKVEPVDQKWKHTRVILRTSAAGEKEMSEVQIKGENVRHLL